MKYPNLRGFGISNNVAMALVALIVGLIILGAVDLVALVGVLAAFVVGVYVDQTHPAFFKRFFSKPPSKIKELEAEIILLKAEIEKAKAAVK